MLKNFEKHLAVSAITAVLASACATGGTMHYAAPEADAAVARADEWAPLTVAEMRLGADQNVYDAVFHRRPRFLRSSMRDGIPPAGGVVSVYLDRQRLGDLSALRELPIESVTSVRYLSRVEATLEFGRGVGGPVIVVSSR